MMTPNYYGYPLTETCTIDIYEVAASIVQADNSVVVILRSGFTINCPCQSRDAALALHTTIGNLAQDACDPWTSMGGETSPAENPDQPETTNATEPEPMITQKGDFEYNCDNCLRPFHTPETASFCPYCAHPHITYLGQIAL